MEFNLFAQVFCYIFVLEVFFDKSVVTTANFSASKPGFGSALAVFLGASAGLVAATLIATVCGASVGSILFWGASEATINRVAGGVFVAAGLWFALLPIRSRRRKDPRSDLNLFNLFAKVFCYTFAMEILFDKTVVATASFSLSKPGFGSSLAVFLGASAGLVAATLAAAAFGAAVGGILFRGASEATMNRIAGGVFVAFGLWYIWKG